ncbi:MAG: hypothetical protein ABW022_26085 [Actinoplanes sp.]
MNKATRMLAVTGLALVAGVTMGAGPASAAPSASGTTSATTVSVQGVDKKMKSRDRVVGYYRTKTACWKVGRLGEIRDRWDDFECDRVNRGFRRGWYALEAQWDVRGSGHHHGGRPHGHGGNGPRR